VASRPTVDEVSEPYGNFMLNPVAAGPGVCRICRTFVDPGYATCFRCGQAQPSLIDAVVPITYSVDRGQMHVALRGYKDGHGKARQLFARDILAVLWRFLRDHEPCVAATAGAGERFDIVTSVPSKTRAADNARGVFRDLLSDHCGVTRDRYSRTLVATDSATGTREFEPHRYRATTPLDGKSVLMVDDTWTTGSTAQSAANALRLAGAHAIGLVVVGRHVRPDYADHGGRLKSLPRPFDWSTCAVHA
jgi:predicted amidophosphoribosyltransferase